MKKILIICCLCLFSILNTKGADKPVLKFNANSRFKIVQFTDIHIQYDSYRSDSALVMMSKVIQREKPDLVVLTGDVVGSDNRKKAWHKVAQVMIDAKVPWAAMLGNHDAEYELDKEQTMDAIVSLPYNLTARGPKEIAGEGNYVIPIQSSKSKKTEAVLYILDSEEREPNVKEWMAPSQVQWYKDQSTAFTKQNNGAPLPALAFFHIPFPEFADVIGKSTTYGISNEKLHKRPKIHSNLFEAFVEKKDVMGAFVGHEHNNNYIGVLNDICLGFGQAGGRQIYGDLGSGARVIELYEGQRKFDSWILKLYDNSRELDIWKPNPNVARTFFVTYPDSFLEKKESPDKISMITQVAKVRLQLGGSGSAIIDWGDGSKKEVVSLHKESLAQVDHTYAGGSTHTITINGENITALNCKDAGLKYLDVRKNPELTFLDCSDNQLMQLNLKQNTALKTVWCNGNQLTNIDVSQNVLLTELYCYRNRLVNLDVSKNTALTWLNCYQNELKSLDLTENTALRRLDCYENKLQSLDLSNNPSAYWVVCSDNQLSTESMNALFNTLQKGKSPGKIFIGGNPGEKDCDRTMAKNNNWSVSIRY